MGCGACGACAYFRRRVVYISLNSSLAWQRCLIIGEARIRDDNILTPYAQIRPEVAGHFEKPQTKQCTFVPHISTTRHARRDL